MSDLERLERAKELGKLLNEFKLYIMDSVMDGQGEDVKSNYTLLKASLDKFQIKKDMDSIWRLFL